MCYEQVSLWKYQLLSITFFFLKWCFYVYLQVSTGQQAHSLSAVLSPGLWCTIHVIPLYRLYKEIHHKAGNCMSAKSTQQPSGTSFIYSVKLDDENRIVYVSFPQCSCVMTRHRHRQYTDTCKLGAGRQHSEYISFSPCQSVTQTGLQSCHKKCSPYELTQASTYEMTNAHHNFPWLKVKSSKGWSEV